MSNLSEIQSTDVDGCLIVLIGLPELTSYLLILYGILLTLMIIVDFNFCTKGYYSMLGGYFFLASCRIPQLISFDHFLLNDFTPS